MSSKVKGITVELSADVSGVQTALNGLNSSLAQTQKKLSSLDKGLSIDPGNLDLIAQKQEVLSDAIQNTTNKLEVLRKAQEEAQKNIGTDEGALGQFESLSNEIAETEKDLKKLTDEEKSFQKEALAAKVGASAFGQGLMTIASAAETVASKTAALSAVAAAALTSLVTIGVQGAQSAKEWTELSNQIGVSTQAIQKWEYASSAMGTDINDIVGAVNNMKSHLNDTSGMWDKIGVKVKDANGHFKSTEQIFDETVRALGRISNETERDIAAMNVFGDSAGKISQIIDDGGRSLKAFGNEAENLGLVISEEDIQNLNSFNKSLDLMKTQLNAALVQLAIPVMEELKPIIAAVADAIKKVASYLATLDPAIVKIVVVVLAVIAAISPLASLIANVSLTLLGLSVAGPMAAAGLSSLLPYVALIAALAVAGAALGYAIATLVNAFEDFKAETGSTAGAIQKMIQSAASGENAFAQLAGSIVGVFSPVAGQILTIAGGVANGVNAVKSAFARMTSIFENFQDKAAQFGMNIMKSFASGITSAINTVINAVQRLINMMSNLWSSAERDASYAGSRTANAYVSSYNSTSSMARLTAPTASPSYSRPLSSSPSYLSSAPVASALNNLATSIDNMNSASPTTVNVELVGSAKNIFDTVRVQNNTLQTATGYHALA